MRYKYQKTQFENIFFINLYLSKIPKEIRYHGHRGILLSPGLGIN